jgi:hypothetical protein
MHSLSLAMVVGGWEWLQKSSQNLGMMFGMLDNVVAQC